MDPPEWARIPSTAVARRGDRVSRTLDELSSGLETYRRLYRRTRDQRDALRRRLAECERRLADCHRERRTFGRLIFGRMRAAQRLRRRHDVRIWNR